MIFRSSTPRTDASRTESSSQFDDESSTRLPSNNQRNLVWWALATAGLCALPQLLFKIATFRRDMSVANRLFPSVAALTESERLLIFAPHPDDETLGTGGLISQARQKGIAVRVVFLTNGDGSGSTQIGETLRRGQRPTFLEMAVLRQSEAIAALEKLGVSPDDIVFLGYPDGGLMKIWKSHWRDDSPLRSSFTEVDRAPYPNAQTPNAPYCGQSVVRDIALSIENFRPTRVLTTDGNDTHGDHRAAFCFLLAALEQLRLQSSTRSWAETIEFWTYLVHHAIWPVPHGYRPNETLAPPHVLTKIGASWMDSVLDSNARRAKKTALSCYRSQMTWTPNYLKGFLRRNELFNRAPQAALLSESSTRNAPTTLLRDPTTDSLTRQTFPATDLTGLSMVSMEEKGTIRLQIGTRLPPSPRCVYTLCFHILNSDLNESQTFSLEAKCGNGIWKTSHSGENVSSPHFSTDASLDGLEIKIPLDLLNPRQETATVLLSSSTRFAGKTLDETSTVALRLSA